MQQLWHQTLYPDVHATNLFLQVQLAAEQAGIRPHGEGDNDDDMGGELGRLQHVDAARGGQVRGSASRPDPGGVGDDDFSAVIHPSFGRFPEAQLVALDLMGAGKNKNKKKS